METAERTETREEKEQRLDDLAQELYQSSERIITPIYPWLVVRIMPKEQRIGTIFLPDKQNRLFYEGIVLATWKPFYRHYTGNLKFDGGRMANKAVLVQSAVDLGDRVVFMHFEGQPIPYFDEKNYRMIHEVETHPNGGVWGKLHYKDDEDLRDKLNKLFAGRTSKTISGK